jgi:hypothetical protein
MFRESLTPLPRLRALPCCLALALAGLPGAAGHAGTAPVSSGKLALGWPAQSPSPRKPEGTIVVTSCADGGSGSLRDALASVSGDATIDLDGLTCSTITLTTGALVEPAGAGTVVIQRSAAYVGGRKVPTLTIDASGNGRVIEADSAGALYLEGLTLRNGHFTGEKGGCVYAAGSLFLDATIVTECTLEAPGSNDALGGGIYSKGALNMNFSTVSRSHASSGSGYVYGGGIFAGYSLGVFYSSVETNFAYGISYGGGIAARGIALIELSLVSGNGARYDGGVALFGGAPISRSMELIGSTIALNVGSGNVGGIEANGALYLYNSTIALNSGGNGRAGGVVINGGNALTINSTIIAHNTSFGSESDISGAGSIEGQHNLVMTATVPLPPGTITDDPHLGALADHGGQTMVMPLLAGSPAIDAGSNELNENCDQRAGNFSYYDGFITRYPRVVGSNADIGAYETGADDEIFPNGFDGRFKSILCLRRP